MRQFIARISASATLLTMLMSVALAKDYLPTIPRGLVLAIWLVCAFLWISLTAPVQTVLLELFPSLNPTVPLKEQGRSRENDRNTKDGPGMPPKVAKGSRPLAVALFVIAAAVVLVGWHFFEKSVLGSLAASIESISVQDAPNGGQPQAVVTLVVRIRNHGSPTRVGGFLLAAVADNGTSYYGVPVKTDQPITNISPDGAIQHMFFLDLLDKEATRPIPTGGSIQGKLVFSLPGQSFQSLYGSKLEYRLQLKDDSGKQYTIRKDYGS